MNGRQCFSAPCIVLFIINRKLTHPAPPLSFYIVSYHPPTWHVGASFVVRRSSFVVRRSSFVVVRPALLLHRNKQLAAPPGHPLLDEDEDFQGHIESYTDEGHRWFDGDDVSLVSLIYGCFGIATALYVV